MHQNRQNRLNQDQLNGLLLTHDQPMLPVEPPNVRIDVSCLNAYAYGNLQTYKPACRDHSTSSPRLDHVLQSRRVAVKMMCHSWWVYQTDLPSHSAQRNCTHWSPCQPGANPSEPSAIPESPWQPTKYYCTKVIFTLCTNLKWFISIFNNNNCSFLVLISVHFYI